MQLTLTFTLAFLGTLAAVHGSPVASSSITTFEQFKVAFNKQYSSEAEEATRRSNFAASLAFIEANQGKNGVQLAINELSDLSDEEFIARSPVIDMSAANLTGDYYDIIHVNAERNLPAHFDWREKIRMPEPINQHKCGAW